MTHSAVATYVTGTLEPSPPHQFRLNLIRASVTPANAYLTAQLMEYWCLMNCEGHWQIEWNREDIVLRLSSITDMVMFRISEECAAHEPFWRIVEAAEPVH